MFDYETTQITAKSLIVTQSCKLIRSNQTITLIDKNQHLEKGNRLVRGLLNIGTIRDEYWVYGLSQVSSAEEELWLVLRDYKDENEVPGYKLKEGLTIKMGRYKYIVRQLVVNAECDKSIDNTYMDQGENNLSISAMEEVPKVDAVNESNKFKSEQDTSKKLDEKMCRVCLSDENTADDPLIESPCSCIGSVRFIHIKCLKHWLRSKVAERRTEVAVSYAWKDFECEVCKTKYPGKFILAAIEKFEIPDEKLMDIFKIDRPKNNFISLELDNTLTSGLKALHIISLDKKDRLKIVRNVYK
jgi:hypothetical protein